MRQPPPRILKTTLIPVNNKSDSLKTTFPKWLIDYFDLKKGDEITWIYTHKKNRILIEIPPSNRNNGGGG